MEPPKEFPFPFKPYHIQADFMRELYMALENGNLGIFESPTGTGKSMSIICGSLKWLKDHEETVEKKMYQEMTRIENDITLIQNSTDNWFELKTKLIPFEAEKHEMMYNLNAMVKFKSKKEEYKALVSQKANKSSKRKTNYKSKSKKNSKNVSRSNIKNSSDIEDVKLEDDCIEDEMLSDSSDPEQDDSRLNNYKNTKIIFCSRTHSQLNQFLGEVKKSPYGNDVAVVVLASRQNYCINDSVKKLKHINYINEQCLKLQKSKTTLREEKTVKRSKTNNSCPYLPGNQSLLVANIVTEISDIEDIVQLGVEHKTCPYYSTRKVIDDAQLILVPYNTILHRSTRISSGLDVRGNILIFDEAHNILDAVERMYSTEITGKQLLLCQAYLNQYLQKYMEHFSANSVLILNQLAFCIRKFILVLGGKKDAQCNSEVSVNIQQRTYEMKKFEVDISIDNINMFELLDFFKKSKFVHKMQGFIEKNKNIVMNNINIHKDKEQTKKLEVRNFLNAIQKEVEEKEQNNVVKLSEELHESKQDNEISEKEELYVTNPFYGLMNFLECLKNRCEDGRIFVIPANTVGQGKLKYQLLNPAIHFKELVRDARAIILAGGTMEPISEFIDNLFLRADAQRERIVTFSCDHILPRENVVTHCVLSGPRGIDLDFTYKFRDNTLLLDDLGEIIISLCFHVASGIVLFFPSYQYEDHVFNYLQDKGILKKIQKLKCVFREPRKSSEVNEVLEKYASQIKHPTPPLTGSLLFSVIGGKLSEGLNFSDDLGRCIVIVGLPYPNFMSLELQEKIIYMNERQRHGGATYYENLCMKAINQCVGRAIRHINDYAMIMLLDERYKDKSNFLPRWVQRNVVIHDHYQTVLPQSLKFLSKKRCLNKQSCSLNEFLAAK